jgi:hypothetical protein
MARIADRQPPLDSGRTLQSSLRASIVEHLFVGELMALLWSRGIREIELLRAEVDCAGYDLVIGCKGIERHIQLKSTHKEGKAASVNIHTALCRKPSGCVLWIVFDENKRKIGPFLWFGGSPGRSLPELGDRVARLTRKPKSERKAIRIVTKNRFQKLTTIEEVANRLFFEAHLPE